MKRLDGLKAFLQGLRPSLRTSLVALVVCLGLIGGSHAFFSGGAPAYAQPRSGQGLTAFRSDKELRTFLKGLRARQQGGFMRGPVSLRARGCAPRSSWRRISTSSTARSATKPSSMRWRPTRS